MLGRRFTGSSRGVVGSEQQAGFWVVKAIPHAHAHVQRTRKNNGNRHQRPSGTSRGVGWCDRCFSAASGSTRPLSEGGRKAAAASEITRRALKRETGEDSSRLLGSTATTVSKHQYQLVGSRKELLHVVVEQGQDGFTVSIRVRNIAGQGPVSLRWWTFNGTSNLAETKEEYLGACESTKLAGNAFVSPFTRDDENNKNREEWVARLFLPNTNSTTTSASTAAQQLAFNPTYTFEGRPVLSRPREHIYFGIPLGFYPGTPFPLGAHRQEDWVNFTLLGPESARPKICFLQLSEGNNDDKGGGNRLSASVDFEVELDPSLNRTGDVWHCAVKVPQHVDAYSFRMTQADPKDGYKVGEELIPDPFADDAVYVSVTNQQEAANEDEDGGSSRSPKQICASASLLPRRNVLVEDLEEEEFLEAWKEDRPLKHAFSKAVILEIDLHNPGANEEEEDGAEEDLSVFEAVVSAAVEVEDSGVTALAVRGLLNEETVTSAASVGSEGLGSLELKRLVSRLHEMDLELILELDCLKLLSAMRVAHLNEGRAIQSLKAGVRFLVSEYNLDGICFLHAEKLTHGDFEVVMDRPPIVEDLCNDPVLHSTKLIAVPFGNHLLPREGLRGFPHWGRWAEVNSRFVEDMRNLYLTGAGAGAGAADLTRVSMRLAGSADLFEKWNNGSFHLFAERPPYFGLNSVSFVGDLPLSEMKTATSQDAATSSSLESEGAAAVLQKQGEQSHHAESIRWSLISSMMVSQGVPFLRLLDLSHENWVEEVAIFSKLCEFRERYFDLIQKETFRDPKDVRWHGTNAQVEPQWASSPSNGNSSPFSNSEGSGDSFSSAGDPSGLAFDPAPKPEAKFIGISMWSDDQMHAVYWAGNGNEASLTITLPEPTLGHRWNILLDSGRIGLSLSNETVAASQEYPMEAKSSILLTMQKTT